MLPFYFKNLPLITSTILLLHQVENKKKALKFKLCNENAELLEDYEVPSKSTFCPSESA